MPTKTHRPSKSARRSTKAKAKGAALAVRPQPQPRLRPKLKGNAKAKPAPEVKAAPIARLELVADRARAFAQAARSPRTRFEYDAQWRGFAAWCSARERRPLPADPATVGLFLADRATSGIKPSSLTVAMSAISSVHRAAGVASADLPTKHPTVLEVMGGIRRTMGVRPRQAAPCVVSELRAMAAKLDGDTLIQKRDRALLVVGFAGAFRRSELVALDVADAVFTKAGLEITIRRSKVDQEARGTTIGLAYGSEQATCPVRTLQAWIDTAGITEGPLFRTVNRHGQLRKRLGGRDVARVVKRTAAAVGLDATLYSGHSLRSGLATSAARAGKSDRAIMLQGRWSGRAMVDRYVRDAKLFDESNASAGIGL